MKLSNDTIERVTQQVKAWNRELLEPWIPSPAAKNLAQTIRNSSPTMAELLEDAGILEAWAEMLLDQIDKVMDANREAGMTANEALSQAMLEIVPATEEREKAWLEANCEEFDAPDEDEFELGPSDGPIIEAILGVVDAAARRPGLRGLDFIRIGQLRSALESLPTAPDEAFGGWLRLELETDHGRAHWHLFLGHDLLAVEVSETVRSAYSSETLSRDIFTATRSDTSEYLDDWEDWLMSFASNAMSPQFSMAVHWGDIDAE